METETTPATPQEPVPTETPLTPVAPDITHRLAEEFIQLSEEFPQMSHPDQLPDEVLNLAATENIPLLDAYLRFRWQEEKRVRAEEERRRRTAEQAVGSLQDGTGEPHPEQDAFLRAFHHALR